MADFSSIKATINANIKTNGNQEITGSVLNSVLNGMIDAVNLKKGDETDVASLLVDVNALDMQVNGGEVIETPYDSANGHLAENNGFIGRTGEISQTGSNAYNYSNRLSLDGVVSIDAKADFGNGYGGGVAFYNSNDTFISSIYNVQGSDTNTEYVIPKSSFPAGAAYIRVVFRNPANGFPQYFVKLTKRISGIVDQIQEIEDDVESLGGRVDSVVSDIADINAELNDRQVESTIYDSANGVLMENNGFIGLSGSISFADQTTYQYSNPVDLDGVLSLEVKALFSNPYGGGVAFYTETGSFISSIYNTGGTGNSVKTIARADFPANAASCRVTIQNPSSGAGAYYLKVNKYVKGVISTLEDVKESLDNLVIPNVEYDIMNYALFINRYISGKEYVNGVLVDNSSMISTNKMVLDVDHDLVIGTRADASAVFFDGDGNYLSTIQGKLASPISASSFPAGAKYIAFSYASTSLYNGEFFTLRKYDPNFGQRASHTLKIKGTRPRIDIYLSDSESAILLKLVEAWLTEDCDVYWECGEYAFSSVYQYMMDNGIGRYRGTYELPIGGNCRYYFQNSTITGNPTSGLTDTKVFGNMRCGGCNFELHDGTIIANGLTYCVHDEGQGQPEAYVHKYHNMRLIYQTGDNTSSISKCIGGGMGLRGECVIDGCTTISDNELSNVDISWHGVSGTHNPCVFKLFMSNNHVSKGIEMSAVPTGDVAYYICCGNSFGASPTFGTRWSGRAFNNEIRQ